MKRPSATGPRASSGTRTASKTGTALDLGPDIDLQELIVEIDLEKLVLDLEVGDDVDKPLAARAAEPPAPVAEPPAPVVQPSPQVIEPPVHEIPATERRLAARLSNSEIGDDVQVSLPRASQTALVNVSDTGVLIETNCQLFPGRTTDVFVKVRGERQALRATVVRSALHALTSERVVYRSALHFERIIGISSLSR